MRSVRTIVGIVAAILAGAAMAIDGGTAAAQSSAAAMRSFSGDRELQAFLRRARADADRFEVPPPPPPPSPPPPMMAPPPPPPPVPTVMSPAGEIVVTGQAIQQPMLDSATPVSTVSGEILRGLPSITNNQTANVDEGGIVKTHGRHLVVLRRGRLFTIDTADNAMRTVDTVDAFPPSDDGGTDAWYDEMLVSGDMVVVIGFNYARSGTEINRFAIDRHGRLTYRDTHHLRSDDYYSSRNYASRLIGTRLIVYTPLTFYNDDGEEIADSLPALRRWSKGGPGAGFERLATPRRIFVADMLRRSRRANIDTTHSVTSCELARADLDCRTTVVLGSESRNFYVAQDAVYVWAGEAFVTDWDRNADEDVRAMLYRIPLDGASPQAVGVWGNPTDQFSFRADADALNVLVRNDEGGERMWRAETGEGDLALLRLPYAAFGSGRHMAPSRHYRDLPGGEQFGDLYNRFIGGHLLYSGNAGWNDRGSDGQRHVYAVPVRGGPVAALPTTLDVTRIDIMGRDAMVIGTDSQSALVFQSVDLGSRPAMGDSYALPAAREGENRSHAYFYRPDSADGSSGVLGLPVARAITNPDARFLGSGSGIFFLSRNDRQLSPAGQLDADDARATPDTCLASCTDWYGNARPIFLGNRIFALMGYELVEGRLAEDRIIETARLDFAPRTVDQGASQ